MNTNGKAIRASTQPFAPMVIRKIREGYGKGLVQMVSTVGPKETLQAIKYDLKLSRRPEKELIFHPKGILKHPLYLTNTSGDLGNYTELILTGALRLPFDSLIFSKIDGKPIVDIGANVGISVALLASQFPNSPILAVEANKRNVSRLRKNVKAYGRKISIINKAFAAHSGYVGLINPEASETKRYTTYLYADVSKNHPEDLMVGTITPKEVANWAKGKGGYLGILKIDIEGAEKVIFDSLVIDPLLKICQVLLVETHDNNFPGSRQSVEKAARRAGLSLLHTKDKFPKIYTRS